jgi:GGDEF domain-containing protein
MADEPTDYDVFSTTLRVAKAIAVGSVAVAGVMVSIVALDIKVSHLWFDFKVPLYVFVLLVSAVFIGLGSVILFLAILLRNALNRLSFFKNKAKNSEVALSKLQDIAYNDPITGIPNSYALALIVDAGNHQGPLSRCLILLDLQHFGEINKKYNHWTGDEYLRQFSDKVTATTRRDEFLFKKRVHAKDRNETAPLGAEEDVKAFRKTSGGDEFFILLTGSIIDGLGYLNRLQKRAGEFEEMAVRILGAPHPFGFHAGLVAVGKDESFDSLNERVSKSLGLALDTSYPMRVHWNRNEVGGIIPNSFQEKIVLETKKLFSKPATPARVAQPLPA